MLNRDEINKILGNKDEGWFPPVEKLLPDTVEEFEAIQNARDKEIKDLKKEGIYAVEIGKCRGMFYPTCSICDWEAKWGIQTKRVYECKSFKVSDDGEFSDGKPCKIFHACDKHLQEVAKLCKEKENNYLKNVKK